MRFCTDLNQFNPSLHDVHLEPCYKKFVLILSQEKRKHSEGSPDSQPNVTRLKRGESSSDSSRNIYPKECNFCKKYRVKRNGKSHFPITIATNMAAAQIKESAEAKDSNLFYIMTSVTRKVANANTKQFKDNLYNFIGNNNDK